MTATYTFDVFSSLDGFGGYDEHGDWGGYWGKDGPEFLARRLAQYSEPQRIVLGATTFGMFVSMIGLSVVATEDLDPINGRMREYANDCRVRVRWKTPVDWPDATVESRRRGRDQSARLKARVRYVRSCARTAACRSIER